MRSRHILLLSNDLAIVSMRIRTNRIGRIGERKECNQTMFEFSGRYSGWFFRSQPGNGFWFGSDVSILYLTRENLSKYGVYPI